MKQIATTLCTLFALTISSTAQASNCRPLDVFSDATNLSPEQQVQTVELAEMYKEKYYLTKDFHRERLSMMVAYLEDQQNRRNVHEIIAEPTQQKLSRTQKCVRLYRTAHPFSREQQRQISLNLSNQEVCFSKR